MVQENVVVAIIVIVFFVIIAFVAYIIYSVQHQVGFFRRSKIVDVDEESEG